MNRDPRTSRLPSSSQPAAGTSPPLPGNTSHSFHFHWHRQSAPVSVRSTQHSLAYFSPFYPSILAGLSRRFETFASVGLMFETDLKAKVEHGCRQEAKVDIGGSFAAAALLSASDPPGFEL